jgi:DNA-binding XRE family transcriptional regulator
MQEQRQILGDARPPIRANRVRAIREGRLMTREELADRAGVSPRTVWSVEAGYPCRLVTKRKIIRALGVAKREHERVFPNG